jgi:glycosyltransferase involved in cell wall biosynthesis
MSYPINDSDIRGMDNLKKTALIDSMRASNQLAAQINQKFEIEKDKSIKINIPIIHSLGNNFVNPRARLIGSANIGRIVYEYDDFSNFSRDEKVFDCFVVASNWNYQMLSARSKKPIYLNLEGVDASIFYPAPKSGVFNDDDFLIFSSGKIEYRKGQDLVIEAFKKFALGKNDVKLVTAWQSIYSTIVSKGYKGKLQYGLVVDENSRADVVKWAVDNGVNRDQFVDLGQVPHHMVAQVLREMDCAIQLSRAEAGTNLVAMEAMACGLPTILSRTTGHFDIADESNAIMIDSKELAGTNKPNGANDWREAEIDHVVSQLERLYQIKKATGKSKTDQTFSRTWNEHSDGLEQVVEKFYR